MTMALPAPPVFARADYEWRLMLSGYAKGVFIASQENSHNRMEQLVATLAAAYPQESANQLVPPMVAYVRRLFMTLVFQA
jgi:hypothetical protein